MICHQKCEKKDPSLILDFIKKLASYEKMSDKVHSSLEDIEVSIFEKNQAQVILAYENNVPIGFALFFKSYSTFLGKANYYLENFFINEDKRDLGNGKKMLHYIGEIAF